MNQNIFDYNIATQNEATRVLGYFSKEYILDLIHNSLITRANSIEIMARPNVVLSLESDYRSLFSTYPQETEQLSSQREMIYRNIIDILCQYHGITLNDTNDEFDSFTVANLMYDFFISNFKEYFVRFFVNYINRDKNNIYLTLNLVEEKKAKDNATQFGKKAYSNPKMGLIIANMEKVLDYIMMLDISFEDILNCIFQDKNIVKMYTDNLQPANFFKDIYIPFLTRQETRPMMLSAIRIELHKSAVNNNSII